ncbi:hypothetical protein GWE18_30245 [Bradyrhizobium sp. CSA112]|nr:hypothetical protein [Bradyrhizobium sp. CSA112]MDE5457033.1 hypothetical protein [Bradyrhizobium sp. CSA112]
MTTTTILRELWLVHPPSAQRNRALQVSKRWLLAELPTSGGKALFFS